MFYPPAPLLRSLYHQLLGLPLATGLLLALCVESHAESITAESIWNKENAIERAQQQLPPNATMSGFKCIVVPVRNWRYICTVEYTLSSPSGSTAPTSHPGS